MHRVRIMPNLQSDFLSRISGKLIRMEIWSGFNGKSGLVMEALIDILLLSVMTADILGL